MLMKMIENGLIKSIDDPVSKYEPRFQVTNPFNKEQITFRYSATFTYKLCFSGGAVTVVNEYSISLTSVWSRCF